MYNFYICRHCGNIVTKLEDKGVPVVCCGEKMELLVPNTVEASGEKHVPVVSLSDGIVNVNVGAVDHPMQDVHFIQWVALETEKGLYVKNLKPEEAPSVSFSIPGEKAVAVYAYCNLHGLWKTEL